MNGRILGALLVAGVLVLAMLSYSPSRQSAIAQPGAKTQQWEYRLEPWGEAPWPELAVVVRGDAKGAAKLGEQYNKLGADGWEYVGTHANVNNGSYLVFKRPKR